MLVCISMTFIYNGGISSAFGESNTNERTFKVHANAGAYIEKKGNFIYCVSGFHFIKYNIKSGKLKKTKTSHFLFGLRVYKGNIYFYGCEQQLAYDSPIYKYNPKTGKLKKIAGSCGDNFAIYKDRIYYVELDDMMNLRTVSVNLKGKKKRIESKGRLEIINTSKRADESKYNENYYIYDEFRNEWPPIYVYLHTPKGEVLINFLTT